MILQLNTFQVPCTDLLFIFAVAVGGEVVLVFVSFNVVNSITDNLIDMAVYSPPSFFQGAS